MNITLKVDTAVEVPVNAVPLTDDTDFKTRETGVAYNAAGMDLVWNFLTTAGVISQTAVTPTTAGVYDWVHEGDGMYSMEIPASGGGSINNDTEGWGWFSGFVTGVLPFRGPTICFAPAHVVDGLVTGSDNLQVDVVQISSDSTAADNLELMYDGTGYTASTAPAARQQLPTNFADLAITSSTGRVDVNDIPGASATTAITTSTATALSNIKLHQLVENSIADTDVADNSMFAKLVSSSATADFSDYVWTTDSLQALRDRGDSAWVTGAGGTPPQLLQNTTIATLSTQTSFTLTAGSADDDAYNDHLAIVTDQSTSTQKAVGIVSDYTGSTKTITLSADPGIFTMAVGDTIDIVAVNTAASAPTAVAIRTEIDSNSTQLAAILADTAEIGAAGAGLTAVPWNATWDTEVQSECTDALNAYDPPTRAELTSDIGGLNDVSVSDILTTQMTESYAANGTAPTLAQAMFATHQMLMQFAISGTSYTVKKLDNSTTAFTVTLDDGTSPTSAVRT